MNNLSFAIGALSIAGFSIPPPPVDPEQEARERFCGNQFAGTYDEAKRIQRYKNFLKPKLYQEYVPPPRPARCFFEPSFYKALEDIREREIVILMLRYGRWGKFYTYRQIGVLIETGHSLAPQIIQKTLRRLRHPSRSRRVKPFLFYLEQDKKNYKNWPWHYLVTCEVFGEILSSAEIKNLIRERRKEEKHVKA